MANLQRQAEGPARGVSSFPACFGMPPEPAVATETFCTGIAHFFEAFRKAGRKSAQRAPHSPKGLAPTHRNCRPEVRDMAVMKDR